LIIYAGKYGYTQECLEKLKADIGEGVIAVDANKGHIPSFDEYDSVIIGSSIYIGQVHKKIKAFINGNLSELLTKKVGLFLVCGFTEKFDEVLVQNFPKELRNHAVSVECFGGEINVGKMNFLHKNIVKVLEKEMDISKIKLMPENIEKLANVMR